MGQLEDGMREQIVRQFSDELNLVIQCSLVFSREDKMMIINNLISKGVYWNHFLNLIDRHQVCPTVYRALKSCGNLSLPNWVLEDLRSKTRRIAMDALFMAAELITIVREMEKYNLHPVVLKGFPMGAQLYGDFTIRPSKDIDMFIRPEEMELAKRIIEKRGFQFLNPTFEPTPARIANWLETRHHFDYWHKEKRMNVELHWRIGHSGLEIPFAIIAENLSEVTLSGHVVTTLRDEIQFVYLVMHGASHGWFRLKWVQDIVVILERGNISWPTVFELAEQLGVSSLVCQAILLAYWVSGVKVNEDIQRRCNEDKRGQKLARMALRFHIVPDLDSKEDSFWSLRYYQHRQYQFILQSGWKRKLWLLLNCFRPIDDDVNRISLPDWLYSLYYVIRPLSWANRKIGK